MSVAGEAVRPGDVVGEVGIAIVKTGARKSDKSGSL